jgi:hypothetical protein
LEDFPKDFKIAERSHNNQFFQGNSI